MGFIWMVLWLLAALWAVAHFFLRGEDLSRFDGKVGEHFATEPGMNAERQAAIDTLKNIERSTHGLPFKQRLHKLRELFDTLLAGRDYPASFTPVEANGVRGEWVLAPNADPSKRLLYLHGGAYMLGSSKSHRTLTSRLSESAGVAVLALDYRMLPEHRRMIGVEDCRKAYCWLLDNGPDGPGKAAQLFVAGDSAGGNLTLGLIAWVRDLGLPAPTAAVAFSPATDSTMSSPSLKSNLLTDPMLGPMFGKLTKVPAFALLWFGWWVNRVRPNDPVVSPVQGDLAGLPPVLIQASASEMLIDDARRYVNKAVAAGSPVRLQTWDHMVHVWQIFDTDLTEARDALGEVAKFLKEASAAK